MSFNVLVVDDSSFMRSLLTKIFNKSPNIESAIEAIDGQSAIDKYQKECPSLVTMDIDMALYEWISIYKKIKSLVPNAKIVMVISANTPEMKNEADKIGTVGYITKPFDAERINEVINTLA